VNNNGIFRTTLDEIAVVRDYTLPNTRKHVKCFVQFCSYYYGTFIRHFSDGATPPTYLCRKKLPGNAVHNEVSKTAFEMLKAKKILN
jgi:hypothetical protein